MTFLTSQQAYLAMFAFLEEEFKLTGSDEIGSLLGGMSLLANGDPVDLAVIEQWNLAVQVALTGEVDANFRILSADSEPSK
ncbi:hypothetical protein RBA41_10900 [Massilia sp. CCM 9210]|uniref:hypothetical protein n=1 Tax=Massilia scottii TaxID=3057166 RepID=UPI002796ACDE|nr:hypothetical protein [Massilia sp. CCM 9210]MDQ1813813.1 hypothetical protein [Massilia sp. CCM 9210]